MKYPNVLSAISATLFGFIGGKFLDANLENYTVVFIVMAIVLSAGIIVKAIPSEHFLETILVIHFKVSQLYGKINYSVLC